MKKKNLVIAGIGVMMIATALGGCGKKKEEADPTLTPTPTITVTPEPTPTPEPEKDPSEVLSDILAKVKEAYGENYRPRMAYDEHVYNEVMKIDSSLYDAAIGEGPMMSVHVEAFAGLHATEGNAEALKEAVLAYQDTLKNDTLQYPMNVPIIQASVVEAVGDYVFFYMLGGLDTTDLSEEDAIQAWTEANKTASNAIHEVLGE